MSNRTYRRSSFPDSSSTISVGSVNRMPLKGLRLKAPIGVGGNPALQLLLNDRLGIDLFLKAWQGPQRERDKTTSTAFKAQKDSLTPE